MFLAVTKKRNKVRFMYLKCKLQQNSWLMHFQVKMLQNGKKNTSKEEQTTKYRWCFSNSDAMVPTAFFGSLNKQRKYRVCTERLKTSK